MIDTSRLVAPDEPLGLLIEPPGARWCRPESPAPDLQQARVLNTTIGALRASIRRRLALRGPVIATGHQAEFFHGGVLAKTIATQHAAATSDGTALFVMVDSDVAKSTQLVVPQVTGGGVRRVEVHIPGLDAHVPVEHAPPVTRQHWLDFFARVAALLSDYERAALRTYADGWLRSNDDATSFAARMESANAAVEQRLGVAGVGTVCVSMLSRTPEFQTLVAHLLLNAARFADCYNAAQAAYRNRHRIRNRLRPVPPLIVADGRIELPLWVVRPGAGRRRLFVRTAPTAIELFADHEQIASVAAAGLRTAGQADGPALPQEVADSLRPRALLLSSFLRLIVADVFIHGIGGAKYDEITDVFVRDFFGAPPPPLACVSATVRLDLPRPNASMSALAVAQRRARDVRYNPQRYLQDAPPPLLAERQALIDASDRLRAARSPDRAARRLAFDGLRRVNARVLATDGWRAAALDQAVQEIELAQRGDRIALDREYFYALHPLDTLATLADRLRNALDQP